MHRRSPAAAGRRWAGPAGRRGRPASRRGGGRGRCRRVAGGPSVGSTRPGTSRRARRPSRRSVARADGRTNRAAGRAAYFAAMLRSMGRNGTASDRRCKRLAQVARRPPVSARHGPRRARSHAPRRRRRAATTSGAWARSVREVAVERPPVAAGHRAGQGGPDPERPGVAERLLDQRPVDRQRARLVEPGDPAQLGDRVEQRDEAAGREDRRGVVGGLRARARAGPAGAPIASAIRASSAAELVVALDRDRSRRGAPRRPARCRRRRRAGGTSRPGCRRPSPARGPSAPSSAARVDHRLAAVHVERRRRRAAIASSGTARMISSTSSTRAVASAKARTPATRRRNRSRRAASRLATALTGQPARRSATPSAVPTAPAPTIPMTGGSSPLGPDVGVGVVARVDVVAVAVVAGRDRVEVDAGAFDLLDRLGARRVLVAGLHVPVRVGSLGRSALAVVAPGLHRPPDRAPGPARYSSTRRVYRPRDGGRVPSGPQPIPSAPGRASGRACPTTTGWPRSATGSTSTGPRSR